MVFLSHDANESQLESLHRNGSDQHNQQLLRRQRDAYDKEELCNAFREYGFPLTDDLDVSTLSWSDITEHTRNILHDVAQSYQQYPRDRPYPQSASTTPVMPLSLLSPRSTPLVGTTTRSSMSLGSSLIANSVSRLAGSVDEGSATYPNPPYPLLSPNSPYPLNYPNILTPSTDESLEDMESCMTPTTEGSDSYEDDDNEIELSNGFTKRNENDRIRGEEEGGSEKNTYGSDEGESVIEYEGQYKDTEIISAVSPMSLSGLLSSPRIVSNGRQYYHSGVHSQSIKSSIIRSPKKDGAQSRHRRHQKDLIHCFSDISPSPYDISLFPTVPGTSIPSSLHHSKGERDDKGSTLGTISGSYIQSSTPPESTPRENVNICPTEVLDFRLRKARETFASLREDIRSNL